MSEETGRRADAARSEGTGYEPPRATELDIGEAPTETAAMVTGNTHVGLGAEESARWH